MPMTPNTMHSNRTLSEYVFGKKLCSEYLRNRKAFSNVTLSADNTLTWNFHHLKTTKDLNPALALNIYRACVNAGKPDGQMISLSDNNYQTVAPANMKLASVFVLAGLCELEMHGNSYVIKGCKKIVDIEMVNKLDEFHEWETDKLIYRLIHKCKLPEIFIENLFKQFLVNKLLKDFLTDKPYFQNNAQATNKLEEYVDKVFRACGHQKQSTLRAVDVIKAKNHLKNFTLTALDRDHDLPDYSERHAQVQSPADAEPLSSETPLFESDSPQAHGSNQFFDRNINTKRYDIHYCPPDEKEVSRIISRNVTAMTEVKIHSLDEVDTEYFCQLALDRKNRVGERFLMSCRTVGRWVLRNKRVFVVNIVDLLIGALIGLSLLGVVGAPIYLLAQTGTLIICFTINTIVLGIRKLLYDHRLEKNQKAIEDIDNRIAEIDEKIALPVSSVTNREEGTGSSTATDTEEVLSDQRQQLESKKLELEIKRLSYLAFLAGNVGFTDIFNALFECERAAEKMNTLKLKAGDSLEDAIKYAKAMGEFKRQEERAGKAGKYVAEFLELTRLHRSRIDKSIEVNLNKLFVLGALETENSEDNESDDNTETTANNELTSSAIDFIDNRGEALPPPRLRKVRSLLFSPTLTEALLNKRLGDNKMSRQAMLEQLARDLAALDNTDDNSGDVKVAVEKKPNTRIAGLVSRSAEGIQTEHFYHHENQEYQNEYVKKCATVTLDTFKSYLVYYFKRIIYRLQDTGTAWALMAGARLNIKTILKGAFPNPLALGGLGIIWWFFFRSLGMLLTLKNDSMNQDLIATRMDYKKAYVESSQIAIPEGINNESNEGKRYNSYFNAGVWNNYHQAFLSVEECRALRRESKHSTARSMPLLRSLDNIQARFSEAAHKVADEVKENGTVSKALKAEAIHLALSYALINCETEHVFRLPKQSYYEYGHHMNLKYRQASTLYPSSSLTESDS